MASSYADLIRQRLAQGGSQTVSQAPTGYGGSTPGGVPVTRDEARVEAAQRLAAALLNEKLRRVRAGEGGATPQSQMNYPQLQAQGPAYGSQAARVASSPSLPPIQQPEVPQGMNIAQMPPQDVTIPETGNWTPTDTMGGNKVPGIFARLEQPGTDENNAYVTYVGTGMDPEAARTKVIQDYTASSWINPVLSTVGDVAKDTYNTVADSPLGTAVGYGVKALNYPIGKTKENVGESMYESAMRGQRPIFGENTWNPLEVGLWELDANVDIWSLDPKNKPRIQAAYEVGLDMNDDGVVDIKGQDAVWLVYNADTNRGFLSQLVQDMAYDPLSWIGFMVPAAGGVRKGTAVGMEAAALGGRPLQFQIFKALNKAMTAVETVGEYGNKVADAPFTVPLAAGRKIATVSKSLPDWLTSGIRWAGRPSNKTDTRHIINTAADAADIGLAADAIPVYGPDGRLYEPNPNVTLARGPVSPTTGPAGQAAPDTFREVGAENVTPVTPDEFAVPVIKPDAKTVRTPYGTALVEAPPRIDPATGAPVGTVLTDTPTPMPKTDLPGGGVAVQDGPITKDNVTTKRVVSAEDQVPTPTPKTKDAPTTREKPAVVVNNATEVERALSKERWSLAKAGGRIQKAAQDYPKQFGNAAPELNRLADIYEPNANTLSRGNDFQKADRELLGAEFYADTRDVLRKHGIESTQNVPRSGAALSPSGTAEPTIPQTTSGRVRSVLYDDEKIAVKSRNALYLNGYMEKAPPRAGLHDDIVNATLPPATPKGTRKPDGSLTVNGVNYDNNSLAKLTPEARKSLADQAIAEQMARYEKSQRINMARERLQSRFDPLAADPAWIAAKQEIIAEQDAKIAAGDISDDVVETKRFASSSDTLEDALNKLDNYAAVLRTDQRVSMVERIKTYFKDVWAKHQQVHAVHPAFARLLPKMDTVAGGVETVASKELKAEAKRQFTLNDEIDIQVARGEIPQETADYLKSPIRNYQIRQKGKWVDVTPQEMAKFAERNKIEIPETGTINDTRFRVSEMSRADLLDRTVAKMKDATPIQIEQAYAMRVNQLTGTPPPPYHSWIKPIEMIRKPTRHILRAGRSIALNNPFSIFRGINSDALSDSLRMYWEGHGGAAFQSLTPFGYVDELRHKEREIDRLAEAFGFDIPNEIKVTKGRTELEFDRGSRTATNEAVSALFRAEEGSVADRVIGGATNIVDFRFGRDTRAGMDDARRQAVFVSEYQKQLPDEYLEFYAEARRIGAENGISPQSVQAYLDDIQGGFTSSNVREAMIELAKDAEIPHDLSVAFGQQLGKEWQTRVTKMRNVANTEQKRVLFSYERRNIDQAIGNVIFYHYWMTRAVPAYARIALRNPEVAAMWIRSWADAKRRAEEMGMPPSMMSYVKMMGSITGFYGSGNPWNVIMPLTDLKPEAQREGWYEKLSQFVLLTPAIQVPAAMIGLDNTVIDPLMLYSWRNMTMAIVNKVRAETGRGPYLDDPYENLLRGGYEMVNDLGVKLNIPGVKDVSFQDPKVYTQATIRYVVAHEIEQSSGIQMDQWTETEWKLWQDAVFDGEAGIDNPIYQAAYAKWADANLKNRGMNSIVPGGMRMRYGPRDQVLYADELTRDEQQAKTLLDSGSQEDAAITSGMNEINELGTENGRNSYAAWNAIAYLGQDGSPVDYNSYIQIGTETYYAGDIKNMSDDERKALADRWVAQYSATDDLASYRAQREAYLAKHPEVGDFKEYQKGVYGQAQEPGGIKAWRVQTAKQDKGFADAMAETEKRIRDEYPWKTDQVVDIELDRWAASQAAYKVLNGIRDSVYDPPMDPKVPSLGSADYGFTSSSSPASSGGSTGSSQAKTPIEKTRTTIENYNAKIEKAVTVMNASGYDVTADDLMFANPYYKKAFGMFDIPEMPYDATLFWHWKMLQPQGSDTSVDAFIRVLESQGYQIAA